MNATGKKRGDAKKKYGVTGSCFFFGTMTSAKPKPVGAQHKEAFRSYVLRMFFDRCLNLRNTGDDRYASHLCICLFVCG